VGLDFLALRIAANASRIAFRSNVQIFALELALAYALAQPAAHPHLGRLAVVEGNWIQLRRVQKIHPELNGAVQLGHSLFLVGIEAAPCHRAEACLGDHHVRSTELYPFLSASRRVTLAGMAEREE